MEFTFYYVTDEERVIIEHLIEKDKNNSVISEKDKALLVGMIGRVYVANETCRGR